MYEVLGAFHWYRVCLQLTWSVYTNLCCCLCQAGGQVTFWSWPVCSRMTKSTLYLPRWTHQIPPGSPTRVPPGGTEQWLSCSLSVWSTFVELSVIILGPLPVWEEKASDWAVGVQWHKRTTFGCPNIKSATCQHLFECTHVHWWVCSYLSTLLSKLTSWSMLSSSFLFVPVKYLPLFTCCCGNLVKYCGEYYFCHTGEKGLARRKHKFQGFC